MLFNIYVHHEGNNTLTTFTDSLVVISKIVYNMFTCTYIHYTDDDDIVDCTAVLCVLPECEIGILVTPPDQCCPVCSGTNCSCTLFVFL